MEEITTLNPNAKLRESNRLLREMIADQTNKMQLDIILSVIALAPEDAQEFYEYKIPLAEFCRLVNPANPWKKEVKEDVEKAVGKIMGCFFWIRSETKARAYHFVETALIDYEKEIVSFKISNEVAGFYLTIKDNPTIYALKDMMSMHTMFQANVFGWCMANSGFKNEVMISIEEAKLAFNGETPIKTKRFIDKLGDAVSTINKKTPLEVDFEPVRAGRNITALKFWIKNNYHKTHERTDAEKRADAKKTKKLVEKYEEVCKERDELAGDLLLANLRLAGQDDIADILENKN